MPLWRAKKKQKNSQLKRPFNLSHLQPAVHSRRRSFHTLRFAVYPVLHANFASIFRKLPFLSFAFHRLLIAMSVELLLLCMFQTILLAGNCSRLSSGTEYWISRKWTQTELAAVKCTSTRNLPKSVCSFNHLSEALHLHQAINGITQ